LNLFHTLTFRWTPAGNKTKCHEQKNYIMLNNAKALLGHKLDSLEGEVGQAKDFCFDDEHWTIRYLVIDTLGR